jgi:hypothetical protein
MLQVGKRQLVIGSANPDLPGEVDEIVFTMNYEDGFVNREIEMARAKFILDAVNNYYGRAGGGNVLRQQVRTKRRIREMKDDVSQQQFAGKPAITERETTQMSLDNELGVFD